jgi:anti-sigma B factor antagonist
MKIEKRRHNGVEILDLNGKLILGEPTGLLREEIRNLLGQSRQRILLNLAKVPYIDSAGIGELVSSFIAVRKQGGALKLENLEKNPQGILQMTKILTVFEVFENEQTAIGSFVK